MSKKSKNKQIAKKLKEISHLLDVKGVSYKPTAYKKAAFTIENLNQDISSLYKKGGIEKIKEIEGIGDSIAKEIEEFLKKGKIKRLEELNQETAIRQVITHFFKTKGLDLDELKENAKKRKIVYSRYTRPAKQLIELAGSVKEAKEAIDKVADWANSRDLDYAIETVFKKWLELDRLEPKEVKKKPYYNNKPMVWSETKKKWFVIDDDGTWLEFAGKEDDIEWRKEKE